MSLEYLESEEKEEYISIREKRIRLATMKALKDLMAKVAYFKHNNFNKVDAVRYIEKLYVKHYELVVEETELFRKNIYEWVDYNTPINYKEIEDLITASYKANNDVISKKKVVITPLEAEELEHYANYLKEESK